MDSDSYSDEDVYVEKNFSTRGMDLRTEDFAAAKNQVRVQFANGSEKKRNLVNLEKENRKIEVRAISLKASMCSTSNVQEFDFTKLAAMKEDQFQNPQVMKAIACVTMAVFYGISQAHHDISSIVYFRDIIMRDMHRFGSPSVSGFALTGKMGEASNIYVVKSPRDPAAASDLTHELFVGLNGINFMREHVVNFALIYGGFRGPSPVVDDEGRIIDFAGILEKELTIETGEMELPIQRPEQVTMVVYESITPSESFEKYIKTCSVRDFYEYYLQMLFATQMACELIGYTHYDAHNQNWLAKHHDSPEHPKGFSLRYEDYRTGTSRYVTVRSKVIATAIDYGMAMIKYESRYIGVTNTKLMKYGVDTCPWPLHDAYKLLMFSAETLRVSGTNPNVLKEIEKIFRFFNKHESVQSAARDQREFYYGLPRMQSNKHLSVYDLTDFIEDYCDVKDILSNQPKLAMLACGSASSTGSGLTGVSNTGCLSNQGALNNIRNMEPKTFTEFYYYAYHLKDRDTIRYKELVEGMDYPAAKYDYLGKLEKDYDSLVLKLEDVIPYELSKHVRVRDLKHRKTIQGLTSYYQSAISMVALYEGIVQYLKVGKTIAMLFRDKELLAELARYKEALQLKRSGIKRNIDANYRNYRIIRGIVGSIEWTQDPSNDHYYPWYATVSGEIYWIDQRFSKDTYNKEFQAAELPPVTQKQTTPPPVKARDTQFLPSQRYVRLHRDPDGIPRKLILKDL
jgi:hypothetical protein